jgi:hypothetical protein
MPEHAHSHTFSIQKLVYSLLYTHYLYIFYSDIIITISPSASIHFYIAHPTYVYKYIQLHIQIYMKKPSYLNSKKKHQRYVEIDDIDYSHLLLAYIHFYITTRT